MILKIVLPLLIILACYYTGLFIYYYKKTRNIKASLKHTVILMLPVILVFFFIEFGFRVLISNGIMKQDNHFFTRNFATAYYFIYGQSKTTLRYIRLREPSPGYTKINYPEDDYLHKNTTLRDTAYRLKTDKDGFILPEYPGGKKSIFFIGGSTTECLYVQEKCRFNYQVGRLLEQQNLHYTVKNAGFSGNSTFHSIDNLLNKIVPYKPESVVLMHAINDLAILLWEKTYHNSNPYKSLIVDITKPVKPIENGDEFGEKRGHRQTVDTAAIFEEFRKALTLFVTICRVEAIKPVLMTQFNRIDYGQEKSCAQLSELIGKCKEDFPGIDYIMLYKRMNNIVRETALKENVPLIDLDSLVPKSGKYIYDAVHLNDTGAVYVANIIAEHLTRYLVPANEQIKKL